jgi:hypothetical protein
MKFVTASLQEIPQAESSKEVSLPRFERWLHIIGNEQTSHFQTFFAMTTVVPD